MGRFTLRRLDAIIIGAGGHGRAIHSVLTDAVNSKKYNILCVYDHIAAEGEEMMGSPVYSDIDQLRLKTVPKPVVFLGIGDNLLRKKIFELVSGWGYVFPNLISGYAILANTQKLGIGNFFAPFVNIGPNSRIGDNNIFNTGSNLEHDASIGSHSHVGPGAIVLGGGSIGDKCLLGSNSTVLQKVSVHRSVTVGAGSVVNRSIRESNVTYAGAPAKKII